MSFGGAAPYKKKARYSSHSRQECAGGCKIGDLGRPQPRFHHSREEARYCDQLMFQMKDGREVRSYKSQVRFDLQDGYGRAVGYLLVDFLVTRADGKVEIHEYKGAMLMNSPEFRHKRALFSWCYPHIQYHTVGRKQIVI